MFNKIFDHILKVDECAGVELSFLPDGEMLISGVVLKREKNSIVKKAEFHFLSSYDQLAAKIDAKIPLAVTLSGKGVLQKKTTVQETTDRPVEAILPNANPNDFYHNRMQFGDLTLLAVTRREGLDKAVGDLLARGFHVLSVSIGVTGLQNLLPYLNPANGSRLSTPFFSLSLDPRGVPADIEFISAAPPKDYEKEEYNVGDQYVYSPSLTAFGAAIGLLATGIKAEVEFTTPVVRQEKENYRYFRYYKASLWAALAGIFLILLINFFFYNHYFSLNRDREGMRQMSQEQENKMKRQSAALRTKEGFLQTMGWDVPSRLSYFADRIAGLVPAGMQLTDLQVNPVNNNTLGDTRGTRFRRDTIMVTGVCDEPTLLNQFSNNLKNIQDFKAVNIRNYMYKKEIQSGAFLMEIITNNVQ